MLPDLPLPLRDPGLHLVDRGFGGGDAGVEAGQLLVQLPQLAAAGNQPAGALSRTDDQRAVGLAEIAGQGDEVSRVQPLAPASCKAWSSFSTIQVRPSSRATSGAYCGCGLDETIGAAHNARLAGQIELRRRSESRL